MHHVLICCSSNFVPDVFKCNDLLFFSSLMLKQEALIDPFDFRPLMCSVLNCVTSLALVLNADVLYQSILYFVAYELS